MGPAAGKAFFPEETFAEASSRSPSSSSTCAPAQSSSADEADISALARKLQAAGLDLKRFPPGAVQQLAQQARRGESRITFEDGKVTEHVEVVKVYFVAEVRGDEKCLIKHDMFDLATSRQSVVMLPLERRLCVGESWRDAFPRALRSEVGLSLDWQERHLEPPGENNYFCFEEEGSSVLHPDLKVHSTIHEVHVIVRQSRGMQSDALECIGLPCGRNFTTREVRDDGDKLHVWCWKSREYERNGRMIAFGRYLEARGVDVSQFGTGSNKSFFQFYLEAREKKLCHLEEVPIDGGLSLGLRRVVYLLKIKLVAEVHRQQRVLCQTEEFLDDGRRRKVKQMLVKKTSKDEDWREAMVRVVHDRLGLDPELQQELLEVDEEKIEYHEEVQPSQGYAGILSQYNIRTVPVHVIDTDHPDLAPLGLPRGNDFVTKEGEMAATMGGSLHVWTWAPMVEEAQPPGSFGGTALEDLRRDLYDVEQLVMQTSTQLQVMSCGLDTPLKQALEKLKQAEEYLYDIDRTVANVDVKQLMGIARRGSRDQVQALAGLADFIQSNFTRQSSALEGETGGLAFSRISSTRSAKSASIDDDSPSNEDEDELRALAGHPSLMKIGEAQDNWSYDFFGFAKDNLSSSGGSSSSHALASQVMQSYGQVVLVPLCVNSLKCPDEKSRNFLHEVAGQYYDNPYHGALHATQVCHLGNWLIRGLGLHMEQTAIENCAFVIAALCHDMKHFGRNNAFCVQTEHNLALLYNNNKVLENMHSASTLKLLEDQDMLSNLERTERLSVRSHIIEYILATDMAEHFEGITKFRVRREAPDFNIEAEADRRFVARMCLKAGDIGHSALTWPLHVQWSVRVAQEFYAQGDAERDLGLPVSALCDRKEVEDIGKSQKGFIQFVCMPLFEALDDFQQNQSQVARRGERTLTKEINLLVADSLEDAPFEGRSDKRKDTERIRRRGRRLSSQKAHHFINGIQDVCVALLKENIAKWNEDVECVEDVQAQLRRMAKIPSTSPSIQDAKEED